MKKSERWPEDAPGFLETTLSVKGNPKWLQNQQTVTPRNFVSVQSECCWNSAVSTVQNTQLPVASHLKSAAAPASPPERYPEVLAVCPAVIAPPYRPSRYIAGISCCRSKHIHTGYNASFGSGCSAAPRKAECRSRLPADLTGAARRGELIAYRQP